MLFVVNSGQYGETTHAHENAPAFRLGRFFWQNCIVLEQIPQELVVNVVMILHLGGFYEGSQQARAAVGGGLL